MSEDLTTFKGEDESAGEGPPALDLAAAIFLFCLGAFFAAMSLGLPVPGKLVSAPGLLPFLTSASLAVMAVFLGLSAARRRQRPRQAFIISHAETIRRVQAAAAIAIYIAALQVLAFEGFLPLFGLQIPIGGFEPATIVLLCVLLRTFWTDRLGPILAVSIGWTLCLSLAFRGLFGIPLPG